MDTILIQNQLKIPGIDSITFVNDTLVHQLDELLISNREALDSIAAAINNTNSQDRFLNWVSNDTAFSVFTTLLVFILGILITILYKYIERRNEYKKLKRYFKYHLDEIVNSYCNSLQRAYKDFYQTRGMQTGIPLSEPKVLSSDFERIDKIDTKELFESISDSDSFSKILSELDFLHKLTSEVSKYYEAALINSRKLTEEISDLSDKYMQQLANYVEYERVNNPNFATDQIRNRINNDLVKFYTEFAKKRELKRYYREIIRPIQILLIDTDKFRTHDVAKEITKYGKDLSYKYNEYKIFMTEFRCQFRTYYHDILEVQDKLRNNINKINWR